MSHWPVIHFWWFFLICALCSDSLRSPSTLFPFPWLLGQQHGWEPLWDTETCFCSLSLSLSLSLPKEELEESCHFFSLNSKYIGGFKRHENVEELRKITLMTTERSIPTAWSKKARWPSCLRRWPSAERVQCIKVLACRVPAHQRCSHLNQPQHH